VTFESWNGKRLAIAGRHPMVGQILLGGVLLFMSAMILFFLISYAIHG
jgi:hypothetical protein